jgi:hypothetical protein
MLYFRHTFFTKEHMSTSVNIEGQERAGVSSDEIQGIDWDKVEALRARLQEMDNKFVGYNDERLAHLIPHAWITRLTLTEHEQ